MLSSLVLRALTFCVVLLVIQGTAASHTAEPAARHATSTCNPTPLLQKGKTQLFERVLTRPAASMTPKAEGGDAKRIPAFSVLFVYDRSPDGAFVQVGASSACKPEGWIPVQALVPWEHTMIATFADRTNRERVLFFRREEQVRALVKASDSADQAAKLRAAATSAGSDLVSIEPDEAVDINKHFYLLPILEAKPLRFPDGKQVRALRVAAVTQADKQVHASSPSASGGLQAGDTRRNFRAAVVFVVDATKSTQPFIDRIREGLDRIYQHIESAKLQDRVRFGLIGYRDDPKAVSGIEYLTKVFVDPNTTDNRKSFNELAARLKASKISSRAVSEDGYAGINAAINSLDWTAFDGRFIIMETDASSRNPGKLSSTGLDAQALSVMAREKHIAIFALHMLTPEGGKADHELGRREYTELARYPGREPLYYPVEKGDVAELGNNVDALADSLIRLVQAAEQGRDALVADDKNAAPKNAAEKLASDVSAIGHAMRLAYLGRQAGTAAPSMFEAWTADRDFAARATAALSVRLLLTKTQLSDLEATVTALADAYDKSKIEPSSLYAQLRSAAVTLSRDPTKIGAASNRELSKEILGEYLDGLPYSSRVMAIDQEDWAKMSPGEQQSIIDDLAVKSRLYRRFHDDVDKWVSLAEGAGPDDSVYAVPIEALP